MKKSITIALICLLIMAFSSTALAVGNSVSGQNNQVNQAGKTEMSQHRENIKGNREQISQIRDEIKGCSAQLRQAIQAKLKDKSSLNESDIQSLRNIVISIRQERLDIVKDHWGKVDEQRIVLRQAILQRDFAAANQALTNIESEQQTRITDLTKLLNDIQAGLATLQ